MPFHCPLILTKLQFNNAGEGWGGGVVPVSKVSWKAKPFGHLASSVVVVYGSVWSGFTGHLFVPMYLCTE